MPDAATRTRSGGGRHLTVVAAAGAVLAAVGGVAWWTQEPQPVTNGAGPSAPASSSAPAAGATEVPEPVRARWRPGAPRTVVIPDLQVRAPVVPVQAPNRTLIPPSDPQQLGWWAAGAKPGAARGSALVTGHTVHAGEGALNDLERLERGDRVVVRTDKGVIRYQVQRVQIFSKGSLAKSAERVFSQEVPGRLVLITCEDWDGVRYLSNVVVTAVPRGGRVE